MRVLFVHPEFPGQFGLYGRWLAAREGWDVCFLNRVRQGREGPFRVYRYSPGAVPDGVQGAARGFAEDDAQGIAAARTLAGMLQAGERFDLIVHHCGFGVGRYLREVFDGPIVGLFEWYFDPAITPVDHRPATAWSKGRRLSAYGSNAGVLLDLVNVTAGWTSTANQRAQLPAGLRERIRVFPDPYAAAQFSPVPVTSRKVGTLELPDDRPIVSFCSRGLEATRGFDVFLEVAARVQAERPEVLFVIVGNDHHLYGPQTHQGTGFATYREQLMAAFPGDPTQIWHTPAVPIAELVALFRMTTVHTYLSDPYVLSWSPRDAMACGALLVAADHPATRDLCRHGDTARMAPQTDPTALAEQVLLGLAPTPHNDGIRARAAQSVRATWEIDAVGPDFAAWLSGLVVAAERPT
jgi:glycosyltransferase involved in cell wall biosynthesis